jgi:tRNA nucleotidyltransferase (CCA-adding enzyme)
VKFSGADEFRKALEHDTAALLDLVLDAAESRGLAIYAVGGPVRDLLLGKAIRDVDLLLETGDAVALATLAAPPEARVTRHDRFGTVRLQSGSVAIDLSVARRETYAHVGALPRVEPGSLEEDLARRDFTVNALALPLSSHAKRVHSGIVDPADGIVDLTDGNLRIQHPRSFHDDPTRVLRAARLGPRLGLSLTRGSRTALRDALRDGVFGSVSGDRLRRELVKVFEDADLGLDPSGALRWLSNWHVLGALEPGLDLPRAAVVPLRRLGRAIASPPWRSGRWRSWVSGLSIWLAPSPPALRRRTLQRFSVRGEVAQSISRFPKASTSWMNALLRARGRGAIDALLAPLSEEELYAFHSLAESKLRGRIARFAVEDRTRRVPISGGDLLEIGLEGPALGRVLNRVRIAYLDGALENRDEALALAREIARRRSASKGKPTSKAKRR